MPVVEVKWLQGRNSDQKKKLMEDIFKAFEQNGVPREKIDIIFFDVPKTNFALKGKTPEN